MRTMLFLFLIAPAVLSAQSLNDNYQKPVASQFVFEFSKSDWRSDLGHPRIFSSDRGNEAHFFPYGIALTDVKAGIKNKNSGPYAGVNDWINFAMLSGSKDADNYITLSSGKGLLVWIYSDGFTSHEKEYDTKVFFHFIIYAPKWPDDKNMEIYYCEDYRSGGTAEVYSLESKSKAELNEKNGKLMVDVRLDYDPAFGGGDLKANVRISGVIEISSFK